MYLLINIKTLVVHPTRPSDLPARVEVSEVTPSKTRQVIKTINTINSSTLPSNTDLRTLSPGHSSVSVVVVVVGGTASAGAAEVQTVSLSTFPSPRRRQQRPRRIVPQRRHVTNKIKTEFTF